MRQLIEQGFDGDGQRIKQYQNNGSVTTNKYFVKSTLLGVVYEVTNSNGSWIKSSGFVYLNGSILAYQTQDSTGAKSVSYNYQNPITGSKRGVASTEPDPLGTNAGLYAPPQPNESGGGGEVSGSVSDLIIPRYADALNLSGGCTVDGQRVSCDIVSSGLESGSFAQCPNNNCGPRTGTYTNLDGVTVNFLTSGFRAGADGSSGFGVPDDIWYQFQADLMIQDIKVNGAGQVTNFFNSGNGIVLPTEYVTVTAEDKEIDTSGLLSLQLQTQQISSAPYSNIKGLRTELQRRLDFGDCRSKLNELLEALGKNIKG